MRHGATQWNAAGRFQGQSDIALSGLGLAQAQAIAARLSGERVDRVYSSDLARSLETARVVAAAHGVEVVADRRLREFAFGQWEGLTWAEVVSTRPHLCESVATDARNYRPEDGESFADVAARVASFLREIPRDDAGRIVVVTHAGPIHAMLDVLGVFRDAQSVRDVAPPPIAPASLTRVVIEIGGARLLALSDVAHLDSITHPARASNRARR